MYEFKKTGFFTTKEIYFKPKRKGNCKDIAFQNISLKSEPSYLNMFKKICRNVVRLIGKLDLAWCRTKYFCEIWDMVVGCTCPVKTKPCS